MAFTALEKTRRTNADRYGCGVGEKAWRKMLREQMRCHKQALDGELTKARILRHVDELSHDEKNKDWMPCNSMLKLVKSLTDFESISFRDVPTRRISYTEGKKAYSFSVLRLIHQLPGHMVYGQFQALYPGNRALNLMPDVFLVICELAA